MSARADVDEYPVGLENLFLDPYGARPLEARMTLVHGHVVKGLEPLLDALARTAHDGVLARLDLRHVDRHVAADDDAELAGAPRDVGGAGARHQRLRRNAADVDAGAAEPVSLRHGYLHAGAGQGRRETGARLTGSDHDGVVRLHVLAPRGVCLRSTVVRRSFRVGR